MEEVEEVDIQTCLQIAWEDHHYLVVAVEVAVAGIT
jgi:hypothetical protein